MIWTLFCSFFYLCSFRFVALKNNCFMKKIMCKRYFLLIFYRKVCILQKIVHLMYICMCFFWRNWNIKYFPISLSLLIWNFFRRWTSKLMWRVPGGEFAITGALPGEGQLLWRPNTVYLSASLSLYLSVPASISLSLTTYISVCLSASLSFYYYFVSPLLNYSNFYFFLYSINFVFIRRPHQDCSHCERN